MELAARLSQIKPSPTLAMNAKAGQMRAQGIDVISLAVGQPDFLTPEHICRAGIDAITGGQHKYTPADGTPELKQAVIDKYRRECGLEYTPAEIVITCGGKHALYGLAQATLGPGDEVIIPAPYWVSYPPIAILAGATPVIVETSRENQFKLTPGQLEAAVTPKTKALILNSPSNPTGSTYTKDELLALIETALKYDFLIWSDEIYEKLIFGEQEFYCLASLGPELKERVVVLNGVSKTYAMTGWRIGWLAGPESVARGVAKIQSQSTSNPSSIAQAAALEALTGPQDFLAEWVETFDNRRRLFLDLLADLEVKIDPPTGAFYLFPDFSAYFRGGISGSSQLSEYLLEKAHVATVPGEAFGADNYIRFSYATSEELIEKGVARIKEALAQLD